MKKSLAFFTTGEFADLHHMNKRTLHYYDDIKLFSPAYKGPSGYRYYTYEQSIELENILALRELNMPLEQIREYIKNPNAAEFLQLADTQLDEIDRTIRQLKKLKTLLEAKKEMLKRCSLLFDGKIETVTLDEEYLLVTPFSGSLENAEKPSPNPVPILRHLQSSWELCSYKKGCGSYLSLEKIKAKSFEDYDGIFTVIDKKRKNLQTKPKGLYLRGYSFGAWEKLPALYEKMLLFAEEHHFILTGPAYETGLNEFAIPSVDDYITQVELLCGSV